MQHGVLLRRVATSRGDEIAVHDFGGDGPSLILLHANGFHGLVFQPLVSPAMQLIQASAINIAETKTV